MSKSAKLATLRHSIRCGCACIHQSGPSVMLVVDATEDHKADRITGTVDELRCSSAGFARTVYERAGAAMQNGAPIAMATVREHALYLDAARAHAHRRMRRPYTHDVSVLGEA